MNMDHESNFTLLKKKIWWSTDWKYWVTTVILNYSDRKQRPQTVQDTSRRRYKKLLNERENWIK